MTWKEWLVVAAAVLFVWLTYSASASGREEMLTLPTEEKVIALDARGRPKALEVQGLHGTCVAEIVYGFEHPEIHVVAVTPGAMRHIGHLTIFSRTEVTLKAEEAKRLLGEVIRERCLPSVNGYIST